MLSCRPSPVRVVVAAAGVVMRTGLIATLERVPGIQVVATGGLCDLSSLVHADAVDVLLMHLHDGGITPETCFHGLKQIHPRLGIVVFAATSSGAAAQLAGGVNASVGYDEPEERLHLAIWAAARGDVLLHPGRAAEVPTTYAGLESNPAPGDVTVLPRTRLRDDLLSRREHEILQLVARDYTNRTIADRLSITVPTVKRHLSNIFTKLGVSDRRAAVARTFPP